MQAGKKQSLQWVLEFEKETDEYIEPVMQWLGSSDTSSQVRLTFDSKEQAIAFARERGWPYQLIRSQERTFHTKNYSNNFVQTNR